MVKGHDDGLEKRKGIHGLSKLKMALLNTEKRGQREESEQPGLNMADQIRIERVPLVYHLRETRPSGTSAQSLDRARDRISLFPLPAYISVPP